MIRLAANRSFRLVIALALIFCLVYGPLYSLNPARAESPAPPKKAATPQQITKAHKRGEVIIKFKDDTPKQVRDQIVQTYAKNEKELRGRGKASKLTIKDGLDLANTIFDLKQFNEIVEFAEPNYIVTGAGSLVSTASRSERVKRRSAQLPTTPNDPQFNQQWALANTGQGGGLPGSDIGAVAGWQKTTGSRDTVIAVIDTGIDVYHPDLARNLWVNKREDKGKKHEDDDRDGYVDDINGWNFVSDNDNVNDDHGHGTAIAGIIAAEGDNRAGIAGVMWQASLMPLKALDSSGSGAISDVVEAIDYAADHGASVINCSFGTEVFSQALLDAINRASMSGALVVASAGNNGWDLSQTPYYPASYTASNLITVAATTNNDLLAAFSNFGGPTQVAAPGIDVLTTYPNRRYVTVTGTSAAAPLVAGVAGLLKTIRGWVSAQSVRKAIIDGARVVPMLNGKVTSSGVVSAGAAITLFTNSNNGGGNGSGNGGGNGGGGNGGGGNGGGGGGGTLPQLDYMRANRPGSPEPRVFVNNLPDPDYDPPGGGGSSDNYFAAADYSQNETGRAPSRIGRDGDPTVPRRDTSIILASQNVNLTVPVVSLNGRAGFGVNLALSYNSRVWFIDPWTNKLAFNSDNGFPAPGWRLGFGQLQGASSNGSSIPPFKNKHYISGGNEIYTYIWVEPDGTRRTLLGTTSLSNNIYKSNDSTNIEFNRSTGVLKMANGVEITFTVPTNQSGQVIGNEMLPNQIRDRHGNRININNARLSNNNWVIDNVIDTLGREIDFYYENNMLIGIRQARPAGGSNQIPDDGYYWFVKLSYAPITLSTNFSVATDPANPNGVVVWEPWHIEMGNKDSYRFWYTSYGQMYLQERWIAKVDGQGVERRGSYTWYNFPSRSGSSQSQPCCYVLPAAVDDNAQSSCPKFSQRKEQAEYWNGGTEAIYNYNIITTGTGTATRITDPLTRVFRTDVSSDGLTHTTRQWSSSGSYGTDTSPNFGNALKTTQVGFVSGTNGLEFGSVLVTDGFNNARKTGYEYTTVNGVRLISNVREYEGNTNTVYRRTETSYNTDTTYSNRHIYGLPYMTKVYSGESSLIAQTAFTYDEGSPRWIDSSGDGVIQWDSLPYPLSGSSPTGRANLTTVTQYSVVNGVTGTTRYASRTAYDSQGNVRSVTDAEGRTITYNPWDNFGSSKPGTIDETHAMISAVTDPAGFSNGVEYDWRSGLPKQSYHLSGSTRVNITNYSYDNHWRLAGVSLPNGGGFSRAYWDNWRAVAEYSIVDSGKTRYSFMAYDGAGRTRWTGGDHPSGVAGRYSIQKYVYDAAGRTTMTSNVTAIDGNYIPTDGEQLQGGEPNPNNDGYRYTIATLDTLDRATTITRPDSQTVTYDYTGCGCAGGLQTFVTDESGRKRKQVYDMFGRLSEAYELQKNSTVGNPISYNRAVYQYNRFDQITEIRHYDGGSVNYQTRTFAYDGYARLQSETTPEAGTLSYTYFNNDLIQTVQNQKPTGNTATFGYNSRNLLETISYNDGGATPTTTIQYDEYGARQSMTTTGVGTVTYGYNSYRELSSETVNLNGLGAVTLGYQFTLSGALKQISYSGNGWTKNVNYDYNYAGAPSGVGTNLLSGAGAGDTTNVINGLAYTSFGGVKNLNFGTNPRLMQAGYDLQRQQMTSMFVRRTSNSGADNYLIDQAYSYKDAANANKNNGRLMQVTDYMDPAYTTSYSYDDYNRLSAASASAYSRSFTYDAWGNLRTVNTNGTPSETGSYTLNYAIVGGANQAPLNNRISGPNYDEAGNLKVDGGWNYTYDAANRLKTAGGSANTYDYDGDGRKVKQMTGGYGPLYYIWSSVLGQPVLELTSTSSAGIYRAYVYGPSGNLLALQSYDFQFYWVHTDHLGSGRKLTNVSGAMVYRGEFDPHGQAVYEWASGGATYLNSHKFTGYERNWATLLDDAKARSFAYRRARFMQPDPLGLGAANLTNPQSLNLYSYVGNDPVNFVDPSGLVLVEVCEADQWIPGDNGGQIIAGRCYLMDIGGGIGGTLTPPRLIDDIGGGVGGNQQNPPCPPVPEAPPGVDISANIQTAIQHRPKGIATMYDRAKWFEKQVDYGGPWDYKTRDPKKYQAFGNFHYGATGAAIGFPENTLLRMAGLAQQQHKDTMGAGDGGDPGSKSSIVRDWVLGRGGGAPPYGDYKNDQEEIKRGIQYFKQGCYRRN